MAWCHVGTCPRSSREIGPSPDYLEELGPELHTQVVHECHPLLAGLTEEWVHGTYIPFFQLAGSAPGKRKGKHSYTRSKSTATKVQRCNSLSPPRGEPGEPLFWVVTAWSLWVSSHRGVRCCAGPHTAGKGSLGGRTSSGPSSTPAISMEALRVESSSPNWLCKGKTARKGDVVQWVKMQTEPAGRQAAERSTAEREKQHPSSLACQLRLPLCLFQFSCCCGPILAQMLLDALSLVPPPCASLLRPLQHNVISSLGTAQL